MDEAGHMTDQDVALTVAAAADYLGITVDALNKHRTRRTGPAYLRVGGRWIRYTIPALDAWTAQREAIVEVAA